VWRTEDGEFRIDGQSILVVNDRQPYDLTIDSTEPVVTCCLFFERNFVESIVTPFDEAVEKPLHFLPRLETGDLALISRIRRMRDMTPGTALEEQFVLAGGDLIELDRNARQQAHRISATRPQTKIEIYHRLCRAREYMHAFCDQPLQLAEIAGTACLSLYHFHRMFQEAFHETPHQYLTRLRLDRAAHLLATSRLQVTEICLECGFSSLGSFSSLFRRNFGTGPREYRAAVRSNGCS
jgi:AraC-like DNA-binding protein